MQIFYPDIVHINPESALICQDFDMSNHTLQRFTLLLLVIIKGLN